MTPAAQRRIVVGRRTYAIAPQLTTKPHPVMMTGDILIEKDIAACHQMRVKSVTPAQADVKNVTLVPAMCAHLRKQDVVLPDLDRPQIIQAKIAIIAPADTDICRNAGFAASMV